MAFRNIIIENPALFNMIEEVRSGDTGNVEAIAAQYYFPALFGDGFIRGDDCGWNAGLNYGYAILRGSVARALAVYGFLPTLGLHHRSTLNPFNLADDLMEPFRPLVDLLVIRGMEYDDELTPSHKRILSEIASLDTFFCAPKPPGALSPSGFFDSLLYHTKNYQGTITQGCFHALSS